MHCERHFTFIDNVSQEKLEVTIPEVIDPNYGLYTWPCAPVLAQYIWKQRDFIRNKAVLEIGAGTALPGIVAGRCGANVHLSDSSREPQCIDNCRKSCIANGLHDIPVYGISWGRFEKDLLALPKLDIILASDCFYDTKDFEDIIVTMSYLLEQNKSAQCWCTYQERSASRSIEFLMDKWKLSSQHISLSSFDADNPSIAGSTLPGNHTIHMYIFTRKDS